MTESVPIGLLFADRIIEEKNGKKTIIGTFTTFFSKQFPVSFPPWAIYAGVTNLEGEHDFAINLVHSQLNQVVLAINGKFTAESVEQVVELCIPVNSAIFQSPGKYNLTFNIDTEQVGSRVLTASIPTI